MATRMKKLLAIIMSAVTVVAAVPAVSLLAASLDQDAAATDTAGTGNASGDTADTAGTGNASGDTADTAGTGNASGDSAGASGAGNDNAVSADDETVMEDGETVMEGAVGTVDLADQITINDYELVAESDTYKMYYYEDRLSVILENKITGAFMYSTLMDADDDGFSNSSWNAYMKSGIVCTAINGTIAGYQLDMISSERTISSTTVNNGVSAKIYFEDYGLGLTVEMTLEDDVFTVNVPVDSIIEEEEGKYFESVALFPFMGYTHMDSQNGYMLVPDGNGALIYLDNKEGRYSSGFNRLIYGSDDGFAETDSTELLWNKYQIVNESYQVMAPIFGMAHLDDELAYLAIVTNGDKRAYIQIEPNGASVNYNRCFARFIMRQVYIQPLNNSNSGTTPVVEADYPHNDLTVSYFLLSGEEANYSGMASTYRNYLLDNKLIETHLTAYNSRVDFLGTDREAFLMGTRAVTVTTIDDIYDIYAELKSAGVESLLTIYKGWQKGGIYNIPITKYKADSHIGGTSALTKLIKEAAQDQYDVYLYNNALEINVSTNAFTFNAVKMMNKRTLEIDTHQQVYDTFYYQLPNKMSSTLENFVSSYTKKGVDNLAVAGISDTLFSYSSKGKYYTRLDTAKVYEDVLSGVSEDTNLMLEQPSAYLWKYTDAILDMPLGSSDYMYLDEEIPFLSIVLKGSVPMYSEYVNFEANKTEFFLQMVESGVYPSFYLTAENSSALIYTNSNNLYSTEFSTYKDTVAEYDRELRKVAGLVEGAIIIKHEVLESGVRRVTYDNGVVIYVNYTDENIMVDGLTVEAMSYKVGDAQ